MNVLSIWVPTISRDRASFKTVIVVNFICNCSVHKYIFFFFYPFLVSMNSYSGHVDPSCCFLLSCTNSSDIAQTYLPAPATRRSPYKTQKYNIEQEKQKQIIWFVVSQIANCEGLQMRQYSKVSNWPGVLALFPALWGIFILSAFLDVFAQLSAECNITLIYQMSFKWWMTK